jgi:hypothetical protein
MITNNEPLCREPDTGAATYTYALYFKPGERGKSPSVRKMQMENKLTAHVHLGSDQHENRVVITVSFLL